MRPMLWQGIVPCRPVNIPSLQLANHKPDRILVERKSGEVALWVSRPSAGQLGVCRPRRGFEEPANVREVIGFTAGAGGAAVEEHEPALATGPGNSLIYDEQHGPKERHGFREQEGPLSITEDALMTLAHEDTRVDIFQ